MSLERAPLAVGVLVGSISRNAGGLFNSVRRSALALRQTGCEVTVYGVEDEYSDQDLTQWSPLVPHVFASLGPRRLGFAPGLGRALARSEHDVLHLHGLWQFLSAQATEWRKRKRRPVMLSPRGMLDSWARANSGWKKAAATALFEGENLRGAACLHALNSMEAEAMRSFGLTNPIAVIPNGADLPQRLSWPPPPWMAQDGRRTLLFIGRLHPKKGVKELIKAWSLMRSQAPHVADQWSLAIAGWDDGGHLAELHRLVSALSLQTDVIFPGPLFCSAKDSALANADAFILPSFSEGLPMAVLEAWAFSRPVFMTNACNLSDAFALRAAAPISTAPELLASQLAEGLTRSDLAELGRRGRALVEARYSWPMIAAEHTAVYAWLRDGGAPPACVSLAA